MGNFIYSKYSFVSLAFPVLYSATLLKIYSYFAFVFLMNDSSILIEHIYV